TALSLIRIRASGSRRLARAPIGRPSARSARPSRRRKSTRRSPRFDQNERHERGRWKSADLKDRTGLSVALRRPLLGAVENAEDRDHVFVFGVDDQIV